LFSLSQIHSILEVLQKQNLLFISSKLGINYLTEEEVSKLQHYGINPYHLYKESKDIALMSFHFGLLSDALGKLEANKITHKDLIEYFEKGNHIPLTVIERNTIESIKKQYLGDIKANNGRIFQDVNNIISKNEKNNRKAYEEVIRDEVAKGILMKKTSGEIARDIARKTGDWSRNFKRIVDFISHTAFDEGRAASIQDKYGDNTLVYKDVYEGACKHCIRVYLTGGIGSEPKIFKLSTLKANGTNIGRKADELKPVIGSTHVNCRCTIHQLNTKYAWNPKSQSLDIPKINPKERKLREGRKPIRITIAGKEYSV
jgi:hypothetical protein